MSAVATVVVVQSTPVVEVQVPGIQGPAGAGGAGSGSSFTSTAVGNVQSNSVVCAVAGGVANPDLTQSAQVAAIVGVASTAANSGGSLTVMREGTLTEGLWNWAPGPVFCALSGGALTQTPPTSSPGAVVQVGIALSPTQVQVGIEPAILL